MPDVLMAQVTLLLSPTKQFHIPLLEVTDYLANTAHDPPPGFVTVYSDHDGLHAVPPRFIPWQNLKYAEGRSFQIDAAQDNGNEESWETSLTRRTSG